MKNRIVNTIQSKLKKKLFLMRHAGKKYTCPFCNYSSKDLENIGYDYEVLKNKQVIGGGLRAAGCYKCGSIDRERLIYIYLKEVFKLFKESKKTLKILHFAPEKRITKIMHSHGFTNYICGDLFTEGYVHPEYVQNINVLNIPYDDNTFDLLICNHVLEHIIEDSDAMKEMCRVLKPGGTALLQVPISKNSLSTIEDENIIDPKMREKFYGQFDHVRLYGQDYSQRLTDAGFTLNRINISKDFAQFGLNVDEDLFVCVK